MANEKIVAIKDRPDFIPKIEHIEIELLEPNEGQYSRIDEETNKQVGLPRNPRWIRDTRYDALKRSITDDPEYLLYNPLEVFTLSHIKGKEGKYVVVGGNQRLQACKDLGFTKVPCVVFLPDTPFAKLRAYAIKSNEGFGQNDYDILSSEWDTEELQSFGMELDYIAAGGGDNWDAMDDPDANSGEKDGNELDDKYSDNIGQVVYEPKETHHQISDLYEMTGDLDEIVAGVQNPELRKMLEIRKAWFCNFNFAKIADYYAYQATPEEQRVFERLGLVLLDRDQLIENGFSDIIKDFEDENNH